MGGAVGKAFFIFLLRQPSPTAAVLKLLAKTPFPTASQSCWERIFAFLFFSFQLFCGSFLLLLHLNFKTWGCFELFSYISLII
jgi:hypothetical protein